MKVSIMREVGPEVLKRCREITGVDVTAMETENVDVQVIYRKYQVTPSLKMIQTISAGVDHLDFGSVPDSVLICSNAGAFSEPVAEHAFAMILSVKKRILDFEKQSRNNIYKKLPVESLAGQKLGIFGYGGIGRSAARIARTFGMKTLAYSRTVKQDGNIDGFVSTPQDLFHESDIILLSMPLNVSTRGIVDRHLLSNFNGKTIVNVARAGVVNQTDMMQYLSDHPEKDYLTDVWWGEPDVKFPIPDNVLLTPHVGGINRSIEEDAVFRACQNVRRFLDGEKPEHIVDRSEYSAVRS
jgi:phosphoglycerate dehydrogenase-like enzyme